MESGWPPSLSGWPSSRSASPRWTSSSTPTASSPWSVGRFAKTFESGSSAPGSTRGRSARAHLTVELPADQRRAGLDADLSEAIRNDLARTYEASKRLHFFTRGERREAEVAFLFLVVCLLASSLVDKLTANQALFTSISQGLVVLGWVAMWQPAQQVFHGVSRRLSRKRYRELSQVPIEIAWA